MARGRRQGCGSMWTGLPGGAEDVRRGRSAGVDQVEARKKALGAREFNRLHPKIRVYVEHSIYRVKTWMIMGRVYRNPLKKYGRISNVVCELVNQRLLWLAEQAA